MAPTIMTRDVGLARSVRQRFRWSLNGQATFYRTSVRTWKRSGSWVKYRVNRGQEFVIGGYPPGPHGIDSLVVGYYQGKDLMYVARVRNGFVPASRGQVFEKIRHLVSPIMPFANLHDTHKSRWGDELTAEKMKECVWLRPEAGAQIEFLEWTQHGGREGSLLLSQGLSGRYFQARFVVE